MALQRQSVRVNDRLIEHVKDCKRSLSECKKCTQMVNVWSMVPAHRLSRLLADTMGFNATNINAALSGR